MLTTLLARLQLFYLHCLWRIDCESLDAANEMSFLPPMETPTFEEFQRAREVARHQK
jgi:hypothetical protein